MFLHFIDLLLYSICLLLLKGSNTNVCKMCIVDNLYYVKEIGIPNNDTHSHMLDGVFLIVLDFGIISTALV